MTQWIIRLIAISLLLTICTYLLPTQSLKKTAIIMFGFIFVTVLIEPAQMLADKDLIQEARLLLFEKFVMSESDTGDAENMIFDEYKNRVQNAVTDYINSQSTAYCSHSTVFVNQDIDSPELAQIETIYCYVAPYKEKDDMIQEGKNEIQQIVIDINGVRFDTTQEVENQDKSYIKELQKLVADYLEIDKNLVHIMEITEE